MFLFGCTPSQEQAESSLPDESGWIEFWLESDNNVTLHSEDETYQIMFHLKPTDAEIHWSSTNEKIATVDRNGVITAVGPGACSVIAEAGMVTAAGQNWTNVVTIEVNIRCDFKH